MTPDHILAEEQFLNLLLTEKDCVRRWLASPLAIRYFDITHELLLKGITWAYNEGVQLTRTSYKGFVEEYLKSPSEVASQIAVYNRCSMRVTKADDLPMLIQRIKQAYVRRKSAEYFRDYNKDREKHGDLEANRTLATRILALEAEQQDTQVSFVDIAGGREQFMKDLLDRRANPRTRLTCGIKEIDDTMNVGFQKGTLTLFCAGPGAFKTTIMMNLALNIWENAGENICFMPLEMPWEMMMQKIVSRQTRINFTKIDRAEQLTEDEIKRIAQQMEEMNDKSCRFKLLKLGERAKVSSIRAEIERRINYFEPRVLVVDYFDNIIPERQHGREGLAHRDIFEDLIAMGEKYGFAVVTAAKLTRDALKRLREMKDSKAELDSTDVHGGQEFGANAAFMYGQIRNSAQPASLLDFFCMKTRFGSPIFANGRSKATLEIHPDFGLIQSQTELGDGMRDDGSMAAAFDVAKKLTSEANSPPDESPF
jgi:replicative DNA helicase